MDVILLSQKKGNLDQQLQSFDTISEERDMLKNQEKEGV